MSYINFISRRLYKSKRMPRSFAVMRVISITGIAVGAATLLVALSVVSGFENAYRHSVLDFNAHVVILKAGEMKVDDVKVANDAAAVFVESKEKAESVNIAHKLDLFWNTIFGVYEWAKNIHDDIAYEFEDRPGFISVWKKLSPSYMAGSLPERWQRFLGQISGIRKKGVIGTTPFLYREGLIVSNGKIKGVVVKGVDPITLQSVNRMHMELPLGKTLKEAFVKGGEFNVILGSALAKEIGIEGDDLFGKTKLTLMVPNAKKGKKTFTAVVNGTFESGLYDYDAHFALMDINQAQKVFETEGVFATGLEIKLDEPNKATRIAGVINNNIGSSYQAITWGELNRDLFEALALEKLAFSIIMGVLVVVAAFNLIGVLVLLIYHRTHEIAVLKSLGFKNDLLQKIFVHGGITIGFVGTFLGVAAGILISLLIERFHFIKLEPEIYFLSNLPVKISFVVCAAIFIFSMAMSWFTSKFASKWISSLPISEGLRM